MTATLAGAMRLNAPRRTGPWSSSQVAALVAGNLCAVLLAFVGWLRASDEGQAGDQILWLNVSLAGVVVAIAVNGFFLARGRQTVRLATPVALAGVPRAMVAATPSLNGSGRVAGTAASQSGRVVSVSGLKRYHRPECALVAGKAVEAAQSASFAGSGLLPCEVCEP